MLALDLQGACHVNAAKKEMGIASNNLFKRTEDKAK
jgi:hypothetical protein